jgi:hypothetical protein
LPLLGLLPVRGRGVGLGEPLCDDVVEQAVDDLVVAAVGPRVVPRDHLVDVVRVARDAAAVVLPRGERPAVLVVRVERVDAGVGGLECGEVLEELRGRGGEVGEARGLPRLRVVDEALHVADDGDAVARALERLVVEPAVLLLELREVAERLEEVAELVGGDRAGDRQDVAVGVGAHPGLHLALVVGDALDLDLGDRRVLRLELLDVVVEGAVLDEVGAPRQHRDRAARLAARVLLAARPARAGGREGEHGDGRRRGGEARTSLVKEHRRSSRRRRDLGVPAAAVTASRPCAV